MPTCDATGLSYGCELVILRVPWFLINKSSMVSY